MRRQLRSSRTPTPDERPRERQAPDGGGPGGRYEPSAERAQTEPLAALVAISVLAIAVGLYATFLTGVLPGQSNSAVEGPVADNVWEDLQEEGHYPNETGPRGDRESYPASDVDSETIPAATNVYVVVTTTDERGNDLVVGRTHFGPDGDPVYPTDGPPESAETEVRSVPVEMEAGAVRGGTLRVEVW